MATVDVLYTCPVVVEVDTDTGEIVRVNVDDENVRLDPAQIEAAKDNEAERVATEIAEEATWPAWEFGF